jgi:carbon monoxide dehydrogenase subunit G
MRLDHNFVVPVPAPVAWAALLDAQSATPLLPGMALNTRAEDRFAGTLRVRIGPVTLCYQGSGRYVVRDPSARRLMVEAAGQDVHGGGTAAATATATLREGPNQTTRVELCAELAMTGRLMRSNRRLVQAAGAHLLSQVGDALTARVAADAQADGISPTGSPAPPEPRRLRGVVPYVCAFVLGGLLTLAMIVVFA